MNPTRRRRRRTVAAGGLVALLMALGCATPLDKGREYWADGEGKFDAAEVFYQQAIDKNDDEEISLREFADRFDGGFRPGRGGFGPPFKKKKKCFL